MKRFKLYLTAFLAVCLAVCSGCKKSNGGQEDLDGYIKLGINEFKNALDKETDPQILDYRSAEDFAAGHIKGAINVDGSNPASWSSDEGEFMTTLKTIFTTNKKIFIYGKSGWNAFGMTLPGRIANTWGEFNTLNLESGYNKENLEKAGYIIVTGNN